MSPTHVIIDTSAPTTPTTVTLPSRDPSPPPQVSPIQSTNSDSTLRPSTTSPRNALSRPPRLPRVRTPPSASSPHPTIVTPTLANPAGAEETGTASEHLPHSFSSPIPSLSQSYPQELDREHGVELLSPPSSGTSSPFTTFSPFVAPQALSPFTVVQPLDHNSSPEIHSRSPNPASRALSPSQSTTTSTTQSSYQSLPTSPVIATSNLSSPINVTHEQTRSPSPREELSYLSSPSPINFTSPDALSPRSPHSDLSDLDFESDVDVLSDQGSEGSDRSWAGVSSASGSSANRR
ncbi:hypothetical protein P691DRAFT_421560 [Macrolepiota fuliginosa MF-IS2]|uniref:Uncharacterized protein n=1 Tax=Macrolepiota fuliginosa MF-IS2 TaxID=1400762 RepID=A0A9P5X2S5_9AGAR|nr:hypothetical protein P691DRAFT_421560 [Macrolepiota fuliginosa MF-IS2]